MKAATPITDTILEQLGGNKFIAMTGARIAYDEAEKYILVRFRGSRKANGLMVQLEPSDLYSMYFSRNGWSVCVRKDVYWDQLQNIFTDVTGLATRL